MRMRMKWCTKKVVVLAALQFVSLVYGLPPQSVSFTATDNDNYLESIENTVHDYRADEEELIAENAEKLEQIKNYLAQLLLIPWNGNGLPLLYVEDEPPQHNRPGEMMNEQEDENIAPDFVQSDDDYHHQMPYNKRSRYYRKYPWKRQNSRQTYDAENRYLCQPSKDDVFRLLVALHEARQGNKGRTINFCNRKRPATAIFTNIRFLG